MQPSHIPRTKRTTKRPVKFLQAAWQHKATLQMNMFKLEMCHFRGRSAMKCVQQTSSIFRQETFEAPNYAEIRTRDIRESRLCLTWYIKIRYRLESPKGKTRPIESMSQFLWANTLHNRWSTYWFASRWVASLNVGSNMRLHRIRMLTAFQELRHCPGSTCPWIENYNRMLLKDRRRHDT